MTIEAVRADNYGHCAARAMKNATRRTLRARRSSVLTVSALLAALLLPAAHAQTLDTTYLPQPDHWVRTLAADPDGQLLVGGYFQFIGNPLPVLQPGFTRLALNGDVAPGAWPTSRSGPVWSTSLLDDGRMLIAGALTAVDDVPRKGVARLEADGSLDAGFPDLQLGGSGLAYALAVQADGEILVAGSFTSVAGVPRSNLARLNADGTLDTAFAPEVDGSIGCMALQPDGKILIGGYVQSVDGVPRNYLARIEADGHLDTGFAASAGGLVFAFALQPDGRILVGGWFTLVNGVRRPYLARLEADGRVDQDFVDAGLSGSVTAIALQADGKLAIGGSFDTVGGQPRAHLARLEADGQLDAGFADLGVNDRVDALALQGGHLYVGGIFTAIDGHSTRYLARGLLPDTATTAFDVSADLDSVTWRRGGSSPELAAPPALARSLDGGLSWTTLGVMHHVDDGWRLDGLAPLLGVGQPLHLRAEGIVASGNSQGRVRLQQAFAFVDTIFDDGFEEGQAGRR